MQTTTDFPDLDSLASAPDDLTPDEKDELQELLAASLQPKAPVSAAPADDLDALLGESLAMREEEEAVKRAREKLKRTGISVAERRETEAMIRGWEARKVWQTAANVAVWDHHICDNCGAEHKTFSHLMHHQTHRHTPSTQRFVTGDDWVEGLPNLVALQEISTPMCQECAEEFGMDIAQAGVEWTQG